MLISLTILLAYLVGAVPFGIIISRIFGIKDIRSEGSGNIGAANVWRVAG
ncbi:glycerol-3-phosphate acyltransferase, partial [candidate division KSB1 bacterium]|nr:glycerol-3-phosphate acyltransferase [candidate division KSB1 bacterium]